MQLTDLGTPTSHPSFIGSWLVEPASLCDDLISLFEANPGKHARGTTSSGTLAEAKRSTDMVIHPRDLAQAGYEALTRYFQELSLCYSDYVRQWPFLQGFSSRLEIGSFNLQRYQPGGHFQQLHCERNSLDSLHRVFAWMTYLNDVADGGCTSFPHYGLEVTPRKGKTLIWPGEWTHAHTGKVVNSGVKYIITGWMHLSA